jgi:hypothetical protein
MNWASKHHIEVMADWGAPALLATAAGWAAVAAGLPLSARIAIAVIALMTGVIAMRLAGGAPIIAEVGFEPVPFEVEDQGSELLLDDPLVEIASDSRVVQLFAKPEPTPGELVLRIEDYLSDGRRVPSADECAVTQQPVDASVALHVALANIRASLR